MNSLRSASFLFLVAALILTPAMGQLEASLDFQQMGTSKEPYNVNQPATYKVLLKNSMNSPMRYTVDLDVGPDYTDYSISKRYTIDVSQGARSSGDVEFDVNFRSPELSRGEFGRWASDNNDTSIWERAWYRAVITPLVGDPVTVESYDGKPALIKMITIYRSAEVSPRMGTSDTLYDYRLDVFSSADDTVTLQVAPDPIGPWTDVGSRDYKDPGTWQTLTWEDVSLDFDFIKAHYRFVGRKQSEVFEGPFWPVSYSYRNESVDPIDGFSNTPFTYTLEFNGSKPLDVDLKVWDIDRNEFRPVGRKSYKNATRWETLAWRNVKPSEQIGSEGTSSYYFSFYYPGSESSLGTTRDDTGKVYLGPEIVLIKFQNVTVTPDRGSTIAQYAYSVEVDTALPACDVELQTREPDSSIWKSQGIATYNGEKELRWEDICFDCDAKGNASYRFLRVESPPAIYQGPELVTETITGTVTPVRGVLQVFPEKNTLYRYTYTIRIENVEDEAKDEEELWVELLVKAPNSVWKTIGERKQYDPSNGNVSWVAKPFSDVEFLGRAEYKFLINGVDTEVFRGPEIVAMYKNLDYEDVSPGRYNYVAWVNGSVNMTADLIHSSDNENWENLEDWKRYTAESGWKRLVWGNKPGYRFYEVDIRLEDEVGSEA